MEMIKYYGLDLNYIVNEDLLSSEDTYTNKLIREAVFYNAQERDQECLNIAAGLLMFEKAINKCFDEEEKEFLGLSFSANWRGEVFLEDTKITYDNKTQTIALGKNKFPISMHGIDEMINFFNEMKANIFK